MSAPRIITIGQTLELADGNFTVAGYASGRFRLRNELTHEYVVLDHVELARFLPPGQSLDMSEPPKAEETLDQVFNGLADEARFLIPHLQELVEGTPAVGDEPRNKYAPHIPMATKLLSKAKELREEHGFPISDGTLKRRMLHYRKGGIAALRDGRTMRQERPLRRADERITEALAELIASYAGRSSPSYTRIRAELHKALITKHPDPDDRPALPSLKTVERYVAKLSGEQNPTKPATQRETAALAPQGRQFRPRLVSAPGDECQADTTWFDALVRFPDGQIKRPYLTILVDKRTRSIIAFNFTMNAPTGFDHAVLLANALVPRRLRSWAKYYDAFGLPQMPWSLHLDDEKLKEFDSHRPYIYPRRIITDNGRDYRSEVFRLACQRYGIHLTEAPPKSPTSKAQVERTFETIKTKFAQFLQGYTSGNIESRGEKVGFEKVLDLDVVVELFDRWVAVIWQNRKHDSLVDPLNPSWRHTPNTMYAASLELTGHYVAAWEADDFIALMPSEARTVQADGIEFRGRMYDSPHLAPMRGVKTAAGRSKSVPVHYDPSDINRVWVRAAKGEWIECTWTEKEGFSRPLEKTFAARAHDLTQDNVGFSDAYADDLTLVLLDDIVDEDVERKRAAAQRRKVLKAAERRRRARQSVGQVLEASARDTSDFEDFTDLRVV